MPESDPYYSYINNMASASLMIGDDAGRFMPHEIMTREQTVTVLYNTFKGYMDSGKKRLFTDSDSISPWAQEAVSILAGNDIAAGYIDGSFKPKTGVTKPDLNIMMARIYARADLLNNDSIPNSGCQAVAYTYKAPEFTGLSQTPFSPDPEHGQASPTPEPAETLTMLAFEPAQDLLSPTPGFAPNQVSPTLGPVQDLASPTPGAAQDLASLDPEPTQALPASSSESASTPLEPAVQDQADPEPEPTESLSAPEPETPANGINPDKPMVALSFDDGPSKNTSRLVGILKDNGVKATFCLVGSRIAPYKSALRQIRDSGSEIIGHSWDHKDLTKLTDDQIKRELTSTNDAIYNAVKIRTAFYRAPFGSFNDHVKNISGKLGFTLIEWSIDTLDWKTCDADAVYNDVMNSVYNGAIILTHETHSTTIDAMEKIIPELKRRGYQMVTVSELLGYSKKNIGPGSVVFSR